ncbi:MAG: hypothetical protein SFT90_03165 [Rickettsiales bacterium]|nr:hypothetical protein [Rickettsiales bacterium]
MAEGSGFLRAVEKKSTFGLTINFFVGIIIFLHTNLLLIGVPDVFAS